MKCLTSLMSEQGSCLFIHPAENGGLAFSDRVIRLTATLLVGGVVS